MCHNNTVYYTQVENIVSHPVQKLTQQEVVFCVRLCLSLAAVVFIMSVSETEQPLMNLLTDTMHTTNRLLLIWLSQVIASETDAQVTWCQSLFICATLSSQQITEHCNTEWVTTDVTSCQLDDAVCPACYFSSQILYLSSSSGRRSCPLDSWLWCQPTVMYYHLSDCLSHVPSPFHFCDRSQHFSLYALCC